MTENKLKTVTVFSSKHPNKYKIKKDKQQSYCSAESWKDIPEYTSNWIELTTANNCKN